MLSGDGNAFAMSQLGAVSFDEFLKLLEFSNRRPCSRSESRKSRRALNFSLSGNDCELRKRTFWKLLARADEVIE
jgi:hypothetical protein